ncbi:MAG: hypothetical protein JWQ79_3995 [Mucilaginibacter sp.]|jgi:hypothetical protein|nr:hypothetical protein [Mucilaginibacter sp.]
MDTEDLKKLKKYIDNQYKNIILLRKLKIQII